MSKRMIDTSFFRDPWVTDLSTEGKLLYIYLFTNCDHAGVIDLNIKLVEFETKIANVTTVLRQLQDRLRQLPDGKYLITKFFKYQYPRYPEKQFSAAVSAVNILSKYGIAFEELDNITTVPGPSEDGTSISTSTSTSKTSKSSVKKFEKPTVEQVAEVFLEKGMSEQAAKKQAESFVLFYESKNWMVGKNKMQKWKASAALWYNRHENETSSSNTGFTREELERL